MFYIANTGQFWACSYEFFDPQGPLHEPHAPPLFRASKKKAPRKALSAISKNSLNFFDLDVLWMSPRPLRRLCVFCGEPQSPSASTV